MTTQEMPAYVLRGLAPDEQVRYAGRFHWVALDLLLVMGAVGIAVVLFSVLVDPGFIRLLILPAIPFLASLVSAVTYSSRVLVTDRRVMLARRFFEANSIDLRELERIQVRQNLVGRLLGYGKVLLALQRPSFAVDDAFFGVKFANVRDSVALGSAIFEAATALGLDVDFQS